jgi:hypothetical protein
MQPWQPWPAATLTQASDALQSGEQRLTRLGRVASVLALLLAAANLLFVYVSLHTGWLSPDSISPIVTVSKLATPVLGLLGAIGTFRGWARVFRRLRTQAATDPGIMAATGGVPIPQRLRARARFGRVLSVVALLGAGGLALTSTSVTFDSTLQSDCTWASYAQTADCTYQIFNDSQSNVTFDWQGTSIPVGVTFSPTSGSVAPGGTEAVYMRDPGLCPVTIIFRDATHKLEIDSLFNSPCT